ncbi:MAG TPA: hypothetical protein DEG69_18410 [Flavobacteriaceae bacterium]|jgi:hypothetical protein|nr:hypothetical protein [Flavobacteriaceae bacterium]|tara:strand:+ start:52929 stop:53501 length:573 start_codon:yes stop_codon:yes gene_type:complete
MKKIIFFFFIVSIVSCGRPFYTNSNYFNCAKNNTYEANTDKKQLIYAILERAVVSKKDIPDYQLISNKNKIYINNVSYTRFFGGMTKPNESQVFVSEIPSTIGDVQFCLKSESELQAIANKTDDFLYLTLGSIKITDETAKIGLSNSWIVKKRNKGKYVMMSGGGYILTFKKVNGEWVFDETKPVHSWIS